MVDAEGLAVAEALTNLVMDPVSALGDVKCSANWMWAAKLPGEGAAMWDACEAMATFMSATGVSVDGGKDSLSMAAKVGDETVTGSVAARKLSRSTSSSTSHLAF